MPEERGQGEEPRPPGALAQDISRKAAHPVFLVFEEPPILVEGLVPLEVGLGLHDERRGPVPFQFPDKFQNHI